MAIEMAPSEEELLVAGLTPKQRDVLIFTSKGFSDKEIGELIGRSVNTIHEHRTEVRRRLGVSTMVEAAVIAAKAGLV